ncbi:MAG: hypothetical protein Fur0015_01830 [Ignavibacteriales bacterium]
MKAIFELAQFFYGIVIPKKFRKRFADFVFRYLDEHYSIETAIGLAIKELKL